MNQQLKSKFADLIKGTSFPNNPDHYFKILMEFAQAAYDIAKADEWVSVADRLPEDERVVLVWLPLDDMPDIGGRKLAYIADGRWYGGIKQILGITHWQPLPTPPNQ